MLYQDAKSIRKRSKKMSNSMKAMLAGAALAGLLTGTSAKLQAQTTDQNQNNAGIRAVSMQDNGGTDAKTDKDKLPKHACKGQNDCKGQGGGDKKHAGKNDCKGKGGCATDGSKPPKDDQPKPQQN
ncbi:MAG TPA: hypothetical protein VN901_28765 [Candidatus Acidoferrales bacterium]|nr:hypothetical protein [Candidatus Acidoferrales bacterium]